MSVFTEWGIPMSKTYSSVDDFIDNELPVFVKRNKYKIHKRWSVGVSEDFYLVRFPYDQFCVREWEFNYSLKHKKIVGFCLINSVSIMDRTDYWLDDIQMEKALPFIDELAMMEKMCS